ncbi:MAG: hypothetical protein WCG99_05080 [Candidatus Berkelbacteria bacterium]
MFRRDSIVIAIVIAAVIAVFAGCQQEPIGTGTQMATAALDPEYQKAVKPGFFDMEYTENDDTSSLPAPNCPIITEQEHLATVAREKREKEALERALWWMKKSNVIHGKSLTGRMVSSPNIDLSKASDKAISSEAPDISHAAISESAVTISIDLNGLGGRLLVFKPVAFVSSCPLWAVTIDGKPANAVRQLGGFVLVPVSGAKTVSLSNDLEYVAPEKRGPGCVYLCGLDEVVLLQ